MKKILALTLFVLLTSSMYVSARTIYDSTGRHVLYDNSIRAQRRAMQERTIQQRTTKAMAAAKIDYEAASKELDNKTNLKSNYYQDSELYKSRHNIK